MELFKAHASKFILHNKFVPLKPINSLGKFELDPHQKQFIIF